MKMLIVVLLNILSIFIFAQPGKQTYNENCFFLTPEVAWTDWIINGNWIVCKTTDGGLTWDSTNSPASNLVAGYFVNDSIGYMSIAISENDRKLLKTSNGGITWEVVNNFMKNFFYFLNEHIGYGIELIKSNGYYSFNITKTTDGGITWDSLSNYRDIQYLYVHGLDDITIVGGEEDRINGTEYGYIARTKGIVYNFRIQKPMYGIYFLDSLKGYATSRDILYETINGGLTWTAKSENGGLLIIFTDSNNGFITNLTSVIKTTDKGETWTNITVPTPYAFYYFYDSLNIYARNIDYEPYFYRSTDGGITWRENPFTLITATSQEEDLYKPEVFSLEQNYPNPFNPNTNIKFSLKEGGHTIIKVFDILGEEKGTIINEYKPSGTHIVSFNGEGLPSGIYIYTIMSGGYKQSKKMILMK
ncbi:MAG: T9SS type A sorting domain-containing protein [Syntrophothermus sp.]